MTLNNRMPQILSRCSVTKFFLLLFVSLSICITSCDESSIVGLDVQPTNDLLNVAFQDTTTLITKTIIEDSLRTDELVITNSVAQIGKYIDPVFGETSASLYTQVALSTNITSTTFGTNPICDSIVLSLVYDATYYGKRERKQQTINISEVTEDIANGAKYSNKTLTTNSTAILSTGYNFIPQPTDSVLVSGVKSKPQLRVPLDVIFGQKLLTEGSSGTGLSNNAAFIAYMKGLYITTENTTGLVSGEGNILNFKMAESKITLYYNYTGKTQITNVDSTIYTKYDFGLGNVARFSYFSHNYTTVDANLALQLSGTPPAQNNVVFLQSMAGVKTKIEMPTLMNWIDSGAIAINKAELVIKVDMNATYQLDTFAVPTSLVLFGIDDSGNKFFLPSIYPFNFGGEYDNVTKEYHFNISRYVQQVLTGVIKNNGLFLLASSNLIKYDGSAYPYLGSVINPNRVIIGGGESTSAYQMKLNITYTKLH